MHPKPHSFRHTTTHFPVLLLMQMQQLLVQERYQWLTIGSSHRAGCLAVAAATCHSYHSTPIHLPPPPEQVWSPCTATAPRRLCLLASHESLATGSRCTILRHNHISKLSVTALNQMQSPEATPKANISRLLRFGRCEPAGKRTPHRQWLYETVCERLRPSRNVCGRNSAVFKSCRGVQALPEVWGG